MSPVVAVAKTLRPHQWVKNLFVAAPLVFAKHLLEAEPLLRTLGAVLAFCALSSAVYAFNDLRDVEADRAHPTKRHRPIAAGALSERSAMILSAVLALGGLGGALALGPEVALWAGAYLVLQLGYNLGLKHVAFVDVGLIAAGFLLRVLAGAAAIPVPASKWLLICTGLVAAFFGLGKRAHELSVATRVGRDATATRASLAGYNVSILRVLIGLLAVATTAAYVLYTQDDHTIAFFGTRQLVWTAPFCAIGLARFAFLALSHRDDSGPTEAMLRDWPFLVNLAAWAGAVLVIIYN